MHDNENREIGVRNREDVRFVTAALTCNLDFENTKIEIEYFNTVFSDPDGSNEVEEGLSIWLGSSMYAIEADLNSCKVFEIDLDASPMKLVENKNFKLPLVDIEQDQEFSESQYVDEIYQQWRLDSEQNKGTGDRKRN